MIAQHGVVIWFIFIHKKVAYVVVGYIVGVFLCYDPVKEVRCAFPELAPDVLSHEWSCRLEGKELHAERPALALYAEFEIPFEKVQVHLFDVLRGFEPFPIGVGHVVWQHGIFCFDFADAVACQHGVEAAQFRETKVAMVAESTMRSGHDNLVERLDGFKVLWVYGDGDGVVHDAGEASPFERPPPCHFCVVDAVPRAAKGHPLATLVDLFAVVCRDGHAACLCGVEAPAFGRAFLGLLLHKADGARGHPPAFVAVVAV